MSHISNSAVFSPCGEHRLRLDRRWSDEPRALVCMANPSDAGAERNDPTVSSLVRLLHGRPGIGGFTAVNWESYIATNPAELHRWRDALSWNDWNAYAALRDRNLATIAEISAGPVACRIVAWGNIVPAHHDHPHTRLVLRALSPHDRYELFTFGLTAQGCPKHPMARGVHRIPDGAPLVGWRTGRVAA